MVLEVDCSVEWNVSCGFFLKVFIAGYPLSFLLYSYFFFFSFPSYFSHHYLIWDFVSGSLWAVLRLA